MNANLNTPLPTSLRPLIGISLDTGHPDEGKKLYELNSDYPNAVLRAGGLPILLPHTHDADVRLQYVLMLDALIIPGGNDINPSFYAQNLHPKTKVADALRLDFDLAMLALAEQRHLPTLGICMGCQLMNVYRRGTMHQHIPDAFPDSPIRHSNKENSSAHPVTIRPDSKLAQILPSGLLDSNSRHHQAIATLGHGLVETAHAPDGIIEAFEDPTLPFWIAVEWHPENLTDSPHEKLFTALIEAARVRKRAALAPAVQ